MEVFTALGGCAPHMSGQDFGNDMALDVGEPAIEAIVAVGEPFVVEAEEVEDGGVGVVLPLKTHVFLAAQKRNFSFGLGSER